MKTNEHSRLEEAREEKASSKKWGPYPSERQRGTVREAYSETGDAWIHNRGPDPATLQPLPTLWFRNDGSGGGDVARPSLRQVSPDKAGGVVALSHRDPGERWLYAEGVASSLFTENETSTERRVGRSNPSLCVRDGIGNFVVHGGRMCCYLRTVGPNV